VTATFERKLYQRFRLQQWGPRCKHASLCKQLDLKLRRRRRYTVWLSALSNLKIYSGDNFKCADQKRAELVSCVSRKMAEKDI
jgi:hypothetical protein